MPSTYSISNNNSNNYYWENRVQEQCSLTTSRHGDFTQEMSIKREIEGQINSLWGEKQTDDPGQKDKGKKRIREETVLILKTTKDLDQRKNVERKYSCVLYRLCFVGQPLVISE